jgi:anaerobic carbon-monoxide dehydrogenase iron sulfur subunit
MPHVLISRKTCSGCHLCELACSAWHEGVYEPTLARLRVEVNPTTTAIKGFTCLQTACHKCQDACPHAAIVTDAGVLLVDDVRCNACADIPEGPRCVPACPYDVIAIHPRSGKAFKCDLCRGGEPQCVAFCQNPVVLAVTVRADKGDPAVPASAAANPAHGPARPAAPPE